MLYSQDLSNVCNVMFCYNDLFVCMFSEFYVFSHLYMFGFLYLSLTLFHKHFLSFSFMKT